MSWSQGTSASRVTVRKSAVRKTEATPGRARTAAASGSATASCSVRALTIPSTRTSSVNFMASGFGVVAVAVTEGIPRT